MKTLICFIYLILNLRSIVGGNYYDITTVYRINTLEEADVNGEIFTTYLNTCAVAVVPQTNALGLPYQNKDKSLPDQIWHYPLKSATIPPLDVPFEKSQWKTLTSDETLVPLVSNLSQVNDFPKTIFSALDNGVTLKAKWALDYLQVKDIYDVDEMADFNKKSNVFLYVDVPKTHTKDFTFNLVKSNGDRIMVNIFYHSSAIDICPSWSTSCTQYHYDGNAKSQISIYINLKGNIKVYDAIGQKIFFSDATKYSGSDDTYSYIERVNLYHALLTYKILQLPQSVLLGDDNDMYFSQNFLSDGITISTPWIPNLNFSCSLFVYYLRKSGSHVNLQLKGEGIDEVLQLETEEQSIVRLENDASEMVLTMTKVEFPQNWIGKKRIQIKAENHAYIRSIWQAGDEKIHKIHESKSCVKNNITEIYEVALKEPKQNKETTRCLNGGFPDKYNSTCVCPPGFTGVACEMACGRNSYGQKCSKLCSGSGTECKRMILCTPSYGCTCSPGYQGDKCEEPCAEGTYGADCKQSCGHCKGGCDIYTGNCRQNCVSPYFVWPSCKEPFNYWKIPPVIIFSDFTSVKLGLNFSISNIVNSPSSVTQFYIVQYKEDADTFWSNSTIRIFSPTNIEYTVDNLKPGGQYLFRVLLLDKTLRTNDPKLSKTSEGPTKCSVTTLKNNITITKIRTNLIALSWDKVELVNSTECLPLSYILEVEVDDDFYGNRKIVNIKNNSFEIKNLTPGNNYLIRLKKLTVLGESRTVSQVRVSTETDIDYSTDVAGVVLKTVGSEYRIQWFRSPVYKTYYIKYKLIKLLACMYKEVQSSLEVISTTFTNYTLSLKPNALYQVFVTGDQNQAMHVNNQSVITNGKLPDISPSLVKQNFRITRDSAQIHWTNPPSMCAQINGIFDKYSIELLNMENTLLNTYETKDTKLEISGLTPKTTYKVRIRYENHIGSNHQLYSEDNFTTKGSSILTAQNLTAYKKTANMLGIRWMVSDTDSVTGINVKIQNHVLNRSMNISQLATRECKAWPSYVCYYIENLVQNTKYDVLVDVFSQEFPEGGSQKKIQVVTTESAPDAVTEIEVDAISNMNVTVSWRIPFILNGILRKFLIELEHLSSYDDSVCCQPLSTINYQVTEEQEKYTYVLENLLPMSSYQVTIRAITKRLGQEAKIIFDTPPPMLPLTQKPRVCVDGRRVLWEEDSSIKNTTTGTDDLVTSVLVIVLPEKSTFNANESLPYFRRNLSNSLKSNDWWLAHVCPTKDHNCAISIGTGEQSNSSYGEINNRQLTVGHNYTIVLAQESKYLSARSYSIVKSIQFEMKKRSTDINATLKTAVGSTQECVEQTAIDSTTVQDMDNNKNLGLKQSSDVENTDNEVDDVTDGPVLEALSNGDLVEDV
uniref:Tyrosine-protein kinase receptor Tie-1 n=1 Tax=Cacopsylla melanoneura TaxID=428564 RepID=A0A8D8U176_9HEMI